MLLIISWAVGDFFRTAYYVTNDIPIQLVCCGIFSLMMDLCITAQFWIYAKN